MKLSLAVPLLVFLAFPGTSQSGPATAGTAAEPWVLMDRVAAVVNGSPILLSDIQMEKDFGLLEGEEGAADEESLSRVYLRRKMILEEVREFRGFSLAPAEYQGAATGFLLRFADQAAFPALLQRWKVSREEILRRLDDALTASLYTENRVRFFIQILPGDVERAFATDAERWKGRTLEEAWSEIQAELTDEAFRREVERWLDNLRDRYRVVVFESAEIPAKTGDP